MEDTKVKARTLDAKVEKLSNETTAKVRIEQKFPHPKYGRIVKRHKSYTAHISDEFKNIAEGDLVKIQESRPLSKLKRWVITSLVKKSI